MSVLALPKGSRGSMKKFEKLKQNWEFRRAYTRGSACVAPQFVMYICKGRQGCVRLGITAGKKIGTAVKRNRAKRVITAAFAEVAPHIKAGYDFVIVARTRILFAKSTGIAATIEKQLKSNELWIE